MYRQYLKWRRYAEIQDPNKLNDEFLNRAEASERIEKFLDSMGWNDEDSNSGQADTIKTPQTH